MVLLELWDSVVVGCGVFSHVVLLGALSFFLSMLSRIVLYTHTVLLFISLEGFVAVF